MRRKVKRKVKWYKRTRNGKTYRYPWIGYSYRNEHGNPDFKREISLLGLSDEEVEAVDRGLRCTGRMVCSAEEVDFLGAVSIGAEWTAFRIAEELGIVRELECLAPKYREAVLCMILDRVVNPKPYSKSALYRALPGSGMERVVAPDGLKPKLHDFYIALEKLYEAQSAIQQGLYRSRAHADRMFLYDITSSYVEGVHCPLAAFGHDRDGKKGKMQIVIGLLTDSDGMPVAVEVFNGNTSDQTTVMGQIEKLRREFGLEEIVFVGDRGMITSARRRDLSAEEYERIKYISALTRQEMFQFLEDQSHPLQLGLFDRRDLVEIEYENQRYVLCFNPEKEQDDRRKRMRLIEATEEKLEMIRRNVEAGRWKQRDVIAKRLYRWINHWNMERFFTVKFDEGQFQYERNEEVLQEYEAIDGCYVLITDTAADDVPTEEVRKRYRSLALVEQAFRTMKSTELYVRPVRHWNPERVKGHVFVCMLAYMIVWRARRLFRAFITPDPDAEYAAIADSLRGIWDRLKEVQIGKLRVGSRLYQQMNPLSREIKAILRAANASITSKVKEQMGLVG